MILTLYLLSRRKKKENLGQSIKQEQGTRKGICLRIEKGTKTWQGTRKGKCEKMEKGKREARDKETKDPRKKRA